MSNTDRERDGYRGGLVGPVILIGLGVVFLLNNMGILAWSVWDVIFRLWPILLVAAGLDLLLGRRSIWGSLLALVLTLALLAGLLWMFEAGVIPGQATEGEEIRQGLEGATQAEVILAPAVGSLQLDALLETDHLATGVIRPISGERIHRDFAVQDQTATLRLQSEGAFGPLIGDWSGQRGWDLGLSANVPLWIEVNMGVGSSELDLTDLQVRELDVSMGVGQTRVTLPAAGDYQANVDGAIGETIVVIPRGLEVRISLDTGLAGRRLPAGFRCQDDVCTSPGYTGAENRVDLDVSQAIGNISIRQAGGQ